MKGPTRLWYEDCIADVMYACIIMHNMIVENKGPELTDWAAEDVVVPSHDMTTVSVRMEIPGGTPKGSEHLLICANKKLIFDFSII